MNAKRARPALAVASSPRPVLDSRWFPLNRVAAGVRAVCLSTAGVMIGLQPGAVLAGPQGGTVVAGQGSINRPDANTTVINQSSHNLALDWRSFDVARNELVRFQQPGATATALNRIFDQKPSQIFGRVQANGQIYLVNPNGVYFGPSARLAVGGLVAAGAKIDVDDFMAGNYRLDTSADSDGIVINQGVIEAATGGSVALVGKAVRNEGVIIANAGRVNLVAGSKVALDFDGDGLMRFTVDEAVLDNARALDAAVSNTGTVQADGGEIILHASVAKNVFDQAINNSGVIKAARIDNAGGTIRLVGAGPQASVLNTGTLAADGIRGSGGRVEVNADGTLIAGSGSRISARGGAGTGGAVHLLGERVGLGGDAAVDVSGLNGGGEILAGGDFQGANAAVRNAAQTFVGAGVTLTADAIVDGDGGKVIVWSDQATRYYAAISARGGATGGDGGSVEVSGKELLAFDGGIDTGAAHGRSGQILLDPRDIDITDATTTDNAELNANVPNGGDPAGEILFADDNGGGANVDDFTISDEALEALTGNITLQANRDIKVNAGLSGGLTLTNQGNGETVTFRAGRDVRVDSAITTSGASIAFTADDDSATGGFGGAGKIDINAQVSTAGAAGVVGNINLTVQGGTGDIDLGADLRTAGGSVTLSGPVTLSAATVTIDTDLAGGATAAGNVNMGTSAINAATGAETLVVNATADGGGGGGTVSLGAVGGATRLAALTVSGAALTLNGDLRVNGGGNVDLSGATAVTLGANVVIDTDAVAGTTAAGGILFGSTAVNGAFTLTLDTSADSADANENAGNITLGTTGGGTALAALTVDTRGKGTGTNGTLTLNGDVRTDGGNIDLQNALDIELAGAGATITLDTESGNDGNAGAVIFAAAGDLDSATTRNLVIDATSTGNNAGDVTLGRIGASNRIGTLTVSGNDISFGADVESGAISASTAAGADADSISVAAVTLDANGGALTFSADDIAINAGAVLTSTGAGAGINATFRGRTAATSIGIGDNAAAGATLDLAASELQTIASTFEAIVVGTITTQSGTITVDETGGLSGLNTSLALRADAGDVVIASAIDMSATAGAGFSVTGDGNTTTLAGNITTAGGVVTLDDTLLVDGARTIDTTAGNTANAGAVTITGAIDGANAAGTDTLTIDAARDAVDGTGDANVSVQGAVEGGAGAVTVTGGQDLESLVITGAQVTAVNVRVTGALSLTGTQLNLAGTSYQSDDGAITLTGPMDLTGAGTVTLDSDADNDATDGAITITGAVTDTGSNSALTVDADTGQVDLGNVTVNGALAVTGGNIDLNGTVYTSVTDNVTFTGAVDLDAGAVTTTVTGGGGVGDTVTFSTNVNDAGNDTTLKIVGGAGGVALNGAVGNTGALQALVVDSAATVVLNAVTVGNGGIDVGA
ncbi:MAG: filamentous hemagglutinin N-terminal domain-containing protein, partial [Gammaproteobacteria bacterium]|nr:filamentous hemagglutinin N-terminal domain-containing protein [Gammaproteobacteria bacterium]